MAESGRHGTITEDASTRNSAYRDYRDLKELSATDVKQLLMDMREAFIKKVDIEQSGLLDELISCHVITDMDSQSLSAVHHPTRIERARHLWGILYGIDYKVFINKVLPAICENFGFIIPEQYWRCGTTDAEHSGEQTQPCAAPDDGRRCTRCDIMLRVRLPDLADFLLKIGMIGFQDHRALTSNARTCLPDWDKIFSAFCNIQRLSAKLHERDMARILSKHSLHVPHDLATQMQKGFPCRCCPRKRKEGWKTLRARRLRLLSTHRFSSFASDGSSVYPESDCSASFTCSSSLASSIQTLIQRVSRGDPELPFMWIGHSTVDSDRESESGVDVNVGEDVRGEETTVKQFETDSVRSVYDNNLAFSRCAEDADKPERDMSLILLRQQRPKRIPLMPAMRDGLFGSAIFCAPDLSPVTEESPSFTASDDGDEVRKTDLNILEPRVESIQALASASSKRYRKYVYATLPRSTKAAVSSLDRASYPQTQSERAGHDQAMSGGGNGAGTTGRTEPEPHPSVEQQRVGPSQDLTEPELHAECLARASAEMETSFRMHTPEECQAFGTHNPHDPQLNAHVQVIVEGHVDSETNGLDCIECAAQDCDLDVLICEESKIQMADYQVAMQNADLSRLYGIVESKVATTEHLSLLLPATDIVEEETQRLDDLICDLSTQERMLSGINRLADMLMTSLDPGAPSASTLQQDLQYILSVCQDLLQKRRAFIVCNIYLNSISSGLTDLEPAQLERAAIDLLVLIEANMYEVYATVHSLTSQTNGPGSVESEPENSAEIHENTDLKQKFQLFVFKFLSGF